MIVRAVLGRVLLPVRGEFLIRGSALAVFICLVLLTMVHSDVLGEIIAILLGASIAAIFPTVLGLAGTRYPHCAGTVFGILIGIALLGGMSMPYLAGQIAARSGIRIALWIPACGALGIFILQAVIQNSCNERSHHACHSTIGIDRIVLPDQCTAASHDLGHRSTCG